MNSVSSGKIAERSSASASGSLDLVLKACSGSLQLMVLYFSVKLFGLGIIV